MIEASNLLKLDESSKSGTIGEHFKGVGRPLLLSLFTRKALFNGLAGPVSPSAQYIPVRELHDPIGTMKICVVVCDHDYGFPASL